MRCVRSGATISLLGSGWEEGRSAPNAVAQARPGRRPPARYAGTVSALAPFSPTVRRWFEQTFDAPTPAQERGWPAIASGKHTLIQAPTGSGKTLAAFLWALDRARPGEGIQVLYVSPLKALNYDVERNLRGPLCRDRLRA